MVLGTNALIDSTNEENTSMVLVNGGKLWSTKVTEKLNKKAKKSRPQRVDPYGSDRGDYEVIHHT
jgi:hypothetical protein